MSLPSERRIADLMLELGFDRLPAIRHLQQRDELSRRTLKRPALELGRPAAGRLDSPARSPVSLIEEPRT